MKDQKVHKILMIEDDINNRQLFREVMEKAGLEVEILESADGDFVSAVMEAKPDAISMDLMIGRADGMEAERDGLQAIELLKGDSLTNGIPVFVLTSFYEGGKVELAKSLGAVDFISLQGQTVSNVPGIFLRYLENPKKYVPVHPLFRIN